MKTIAITGGIGSGKSMVCRLLAERGIPVYDTDSAAKRLYSSDDSILDSIEESFGCGIRHNDGTVDKGKLASIVFASPEKMKALEGIVHPAVLQDFIRWNAMIDARFNTQEASDTFFGKKPFCIIESAIILSKPEFLAKVDKVVMIEASLSTRLKRVCERDSSTTDKVIQRMAAQRFDISKVDAIIKNDGTAEELKKAVVETFSSLKI